jgi:hypothetical protein
MSWQTTIKALEREERRQQREALRQQKELERQTREMAKLSAIEQARLEVRTFENRLDLLLSVHKGSGPVWDWTTVAASLAPAQPRCLSQNELRARQQSCILPSADCIDRAQALDTQEHQRELENHTAETASIEKLKPLARRILAGDPQAYTEALVELSPLGDLSALGSAIHFTVHTTDFVECVLKVAGPQIIPAEVKSLTAAEKLSVKPMPRARLHELYQDHICSCILRVGREVFSLLPVDTLLITASIDDVNPATGRPTEQPVLSVALTRDGCVGLDFDRLDPSDAVENFLHRGDFKASRKTGAFAPISPLTSADTGRALLQATNSGDLIAHARQLRKMLRADLAALPTYSANPEPETRKSPCSSSASP